MEVKITLQKAKEVAREDIDDGIIYAIEKLEELGYNCKSYRKVMDKPKNWDNDDLNMRMRDKLYKKLGIYDTMQKAYELVLKEGE